MSSKRIACVTGASSGIGEATAQALANSGFNLILMARRSDRLEKVARDIQNKGVDVHPVVVDVRDAHAVATAFAELPEEWKAIDVLVNNAGLAQGLSKIFEGDLAHWDAMIDTNVKGLLYVSKQVLPGMINRKTGHVINIGSIAGKEVYDKGNVYCSTKFAVDALTKAMRIETAEYGIRVTGIHPGAAETEFSIVRFDGDVDRAKAVYQGFENLVAEDVAEAVAWVVSRKPHVNINDLVIMPQAQAVAGVIIKK